MTGQTIQPTAVQQDNGFTLIEMSIVLVIIGLLVGGVLTGRDLIRAAEVRATVTQVTNYNVAVNTFRVKYNALPGDMDAATASTFGFAARLSALEQGNGNGLITNRWGCGGESAMFWSDLTYANGLNLGLIEGSFSVAGISTCSGVSNTLIARYLPDAKLGRGNRFYVYSCSGADDDWVHGCAVAGVNVFGVSNVTGLNINSDGIDSIPGLSVQQAYSIDKKMDDGYPQTGNVVAQYLADPTDFPVAYASGANVGNDPVNGATDTSATTPSSSTCFDNGNANGVRQQYSLSQNGGAGVNCALSFQFQ